LRTVIDRIPPQRLDPVSSMPPVARCANRVHLCWVDYDYTKRGYLLPAGCKDLIDVLNLQQKASHTPTVPDFKVVFTDKGWEASARLPQLRSEDLVITAEGNALRVAGREPDGTGRFEAIIHVPLGYDITHALAVYANGELRIVVPKA